MKKINSIQVLRGMAAIGIVLYHMLVIEKKYAGGDRYLPGLFRLGQSGVDLFFVISGFIMVTIIRKGGKEKGPIDFLIHRFARIYPNYWFYFFITFAVYIIQPSLVNASQEGHFNFFRSFFLFPSASLPLVLIAWSLIYEVYFYLIFSLLLSLDRSKLLIGLMTWLLFLVGVNLFLDTPASPVLVLILSPYSIEFILGALAAFIVAGTFVKKLPRFVWIGLIVIILIALPFLFSHYYSPSGAAGNLFLQTIVFGLTYSALIIASVSLEQRTGLTFPRILVRIGDISYSIYLSHVLILGAIGRIWALYFQYPGSALDEWIVFPCMLLAILIYSHIANKMIENPSYHFFTKWIGSRPFARTKSKEY